jgi:N-sulfoglucosamine sulfohydrolase
MFSPFIPSIFVLLGLLTLVPYTASANDRPNILILLSDDHSYPFLSCYGDPNVRTPNLDKLAQGGVRFHRYFTACPQCVPSRAALMTGRSPVASILFSTT